jgi:hypothetical protein
MIPPVKADESIDCFQFPLLFPPAFRAAQIQIKNPVHPGALSFNNRPTPKRPAFRPRLFTFKNKEQIMTLSNYSTALTKILTDPDYLTNVQWGKPRSGHAEGTIQAHIDELVGNLQALKSKLKPGEEEKLLLLIHTHDTFKAKCNPGVPIEHPDSHASLGRAFLARFCDDADLLAMVQYHDESFALYRQSKSKGSFNQARAQKLVTTIKDWDLFALFHIIDGGTQSKSREPLEWFFDNIAPLIQTRITKTDIL